MMGLSPGRRRWFLVFLPSVAVALLTSPRSLRLRSGLRSTTESVEEDKKILVFTGEELNNGVSAKLVSQLRSLGFDTVDCPEGTESLNSSTTNFFCVVDSSSKSPEEAAARADLLSSAPSRYVLLSSTAVYGEDDVECSALTTPTVEDSIARQTELEIEKRFGETSDVIHVRAPELGIIPLSGDFEEAFLLRYFFDRVIDYHDRVPMPHEWRDAPITLVTEDDVAEVLARAAVQPAPPSDKKLCLAVHAFGDIDPLTSVKTTGTRQITRTAAICANMAKISNLAFTIDSEWLTDIDFPLDREDYKSLSDVTKDAPWLFPERPPPTEEKKKKNIFQQKRVKTAEDLEKEKDEDEMIRLVAALYPFYEAYKDSDLSRATRSLDEDDLPYARDQELVYDGAAQKSNTVYANDQWSPFKLGPSVEENPILLAATLDETGLTLEEALEKALREKEPPYEKPFPYPDYIIPLPPTSWPKKGKGVPPSRAIKSGKAKANTTPPKEDSD